MENILNDNVSSQSHYQNAGIDSIEVMRKNFTIAEFLWSSSSDGGCDPSGAPPQYIHCYAWCMEFLPEACTPQYWYRFLTRSVRPVRMF